MLLDRGGLSGCVFFCGLFRLWGLLAKVLGFAGLGLLFVSCIGFLCALCVN